jgi:hypothetical protein
MKSKIWMPCGGVIANVEALDWAQFNLRVRSIFAISSAPRLVGEAPADVELVQ